MRDRNGRLSAGARLRGETRSKASWWKALWPNSNPPFFPVKCSSSSFEGTNLAKEGEPLSGEVTSYGFSGCLSGPTACTISASNLPYSASFAYAKETEAPGDGTMKLANSGKGPPTLTATCGGIKCTYAAEPTFTIEGEPSEAKIEQKVTEGKGTFCPKEASIVATYRFTAPTSGDLFLVQKVGGATRLCQNRPTPTGVGGNLKCSAFGGYAGGVRASLRPGTGARFGFAVTEVVCEEAELIGSFQESGIAEGGIELLAFSSPGGLCASNLPGSPEVQVSMPNVPYEASRIQYVSSVAAEARMGVQSAERVPVLRLAIQSKPVEVCEYSRRSSVVEITNGVVLTPPTEIEFHGIWDGLAGNPGACPKVAFEDMAMRLEMAGGLPLYVAQE